MKLGAVLPTCEIGNDPIVIRDFAQTAEELGYAHLLIYDHVLGAEHRDRDPRLTGPYTENDPFHEPMVLYGYLAALTRRIELATGVIILIDVWRVTPIVFLLVLVALEQIDRSLLEAVRLDGGGTWAEMRHVQVPLVLPMLGVAIALRAIDAFRIFATPFVLMGVQGFPVVTSYAYHRWADRGDPATANAAALMLAAVIALVTAIGLTVATRGRRSR